MKKKPTRQYRGWADRLGELAGIIRARQRSNWKLPKHCTNYISAALDGTEAARREWKLRAQLAEGQLVSVAGVLETIVRDLRKRGVRV